MKKFFSALLISLAAMTNAYAISPEITDASRAVVQLDRSCSGTIIQSERDFKTGDVGTYILTAKHCVDADKPVAINIDVYQKNRIVKTESYLADVSGRSWKSDLALLKLRDKQTGFTTITKVAKSDVPLEWGDDVITIGYPRGWSKTMTTGYLGYVDETKDLADLGSTSGQFYRATPSVAPGSSGSGLLKLVDGKYQIIGVLTAKAPGSDYIALYTPIEEINDYLKFALPKSVLDETVKKSQ